jgi:hypothetical protein
MSAGVKLRKLSLQEQAFAALAAGGMSYAESYAQAYRPPKANRMTIQQRAADIAKRPHIQARIAELRKPVIERMAGDAAISLENHLKRLHDLGVKAEIDGKYEAAIKAEIARGVAAGIVIKKHEFTGKNGTPLIPRPDLSNLSDDDIRDLLRLRQKIG